MNNLEKIHIPGKMTLGLELPLDNDWSSEGEKKRRKEGRPFGIPDITHHKELTQLADKAGFSALWVREVPVYDPSFGDGAQLFDTLSYLGYLSGITENMLLGTAAIVLPLHRPLHLAKGAATLENLSNGRLLLGLGLGDRPVEFPIYDIDYRERPELFRRNLDILKESWRTGSELNKYFDFLPKGVQVLPKPKANIPIVIAGHSGQSLNWIANNANAWFNYPRTPEETLNVRREWCEALYDNDQPSKPYISAIHLNLLKDENAGFKSNHFGGSVGLNNLTKMLKQYEAVGVNHMAIHLRKSETPVGEAIQQISETVLPSFNHDLVTI